MNEPLYKHNKHMSKSTMTKLAEFLYGKNLPKDTVIVVAKSAVDNEFSEHAGFSKSQLFPTGKALGYRIKVGSDFTTEDIMGKPTQSTTTVESELEENGNG